MLAVGATVLERLLDNVGVGRQDAPRVCADGHLPHKMVSTGVREKKIRTILGTVRFARSRYVCPTSFATFLILHCLSVSGLPYGIQAPTHRVLTFDCLTSAGVTLPKLLPVHHPRGTRSGDGLDD